MINFILLTITGVLLALVRYQIKLDKLLQKTPKIGLKPLTVQVPCKGLHKSLIMGKVACFSMLFLFMCIGGTAQAQTGMLSDYLNFRASIRGGYDFSSAYKLKETTPYIDYKGGLETGASFDYYWSWFGIGGDFDYMQNSPKNTFPMDVAGVELLDPYQQPITTYEVIEKKITRMAYAIGPNFRFFTTPNSDVELKIRGGLSTVKGGEVQVTGQSEGRDPALSYGPVLLNYHAGYAGGGTTLAGKASLQYNYFFSPIVGFHVGGYFLYHHDVEDLQGNPTGMAVASAYAPASENGFIQLTPDKLITRADPIKGTVRPFGAFAGLTFRFFKPQPKPEPEPIKPVECMITVTAKDKYTGEVIPGAEVALLSESGDTLKRGVSNDMGVVVFAAVLQDNYQIEASYEDRALEGAAVAYTEFGDCQTTGGIHKEVLLNDANFIVNGKVVDCADGSSIFGALVMVTNGSTGAVETYTSDSNGEFSFVAEPNSSYTLYGKKTDYLSQTVTLSTSDYDRSKSKYIQVQVCMDKVTCNDAIILDNILYDLDKSFIREDAKPELNRLVQFMKDNPEVQVELSSHTDSRASNAYNLQLSQRRAQAAVDYIVSQGIAANRLIAKGYGETKLLNRCADGVECSEADHQLNRRTEMKVICPGTSQ